MIKYVPTLYSPNSHPKLKRKEQLSRLPYIGYFYGESGADTCYSIFSTKRLVDYETGLEDEKLPKSRQCGQKARADIEEDLEKDPQDRRRGMVAFVEDFVIPSFGVCHDLIASSSLDSIISTEETASEEEDTPHERAPAKIFRSFGRYHIIKTKIFNGKAGDLTLVPNNTPRELSRALKSVFTSIGPQLWCFELGSDLPNGIDTGDVFITQEDGQWHLGTPDDLRYILRGLDCTVYLLRLSPQQIKEEEKQQAKCELSDDARGSPSTAPEAVVSLASHERSPERQGHAKNSNGRRDSGTRRNYRSLPFSHTNNDTVPSPSKHLKKGHRQPSATEMKGAPTTRARKGLLSWYQRHNDLVDYCEKYGDCNVPQMYPPNPSQGIW